MQFAQVHHIQLWAAGVFPIKSHQRSSKHNTSCVLALHRGKFCLRLYTPPCSVAESSQLNVFFEGSVSVWFWAKKLFKRCVHLAVLQRWKTKASQKSKMGRQGGCVAIHCQTKQCHPKVRSTYWAVSHDFLFFVLHQMFCLVLWYRTVDLWKLQHSYWMDVYVRLLLCKKGL